MGSLMLVGSGGWPVEGCGLFQQDKVSCHKAKMDQEWFEGHSNESEVLAWPPNSPDLCVYMS